jgi:hypothetical protein
MIKKNQTQEKFIPADMNQKGIAFIVKKSENGSEKFSYNDVTYAQTLEMGEQHEAFLFIPFGAEIKNPRGEGMIILTIDTFKN